jgi:hypothetical protein
VHFEAFAEKGGNFGDHLYKVFKNEDRDRLWEI